MVNNTHLYYLNANAPHSRTLSRSILMCYGCTRKFKYSFSYKSSQSGKIKEGVSISSATPILEPPFEHLRASRLQLLFPQPICLFRIHQFFPQHKKKKKLLKFFFYTFFLMKSTPSLCNPATVSQFVWDFLRGFNCKYNLIPLNPAIECFTCAFSYKLLVFGTQTHHRVKMCWTPGLPEGSLSPIVVKILGQRKKKPTRVFV